MNRKETELVHEDQIDDLKAIIWRDHATADAHYAVTFARLSEDGNSWERIDSFTQCDLRKAAKLAGRADSWITIDWIALSGGTFAGSLNVEQNVSK